MLEQQEEIARLRDEAASLEEKLAAARTVIDAERAEREQAADRASRVEERFKREVPTLEDSNKKLRGQLAGARHRISAVATEILEFTLAKAIEAEEKKAKTTESKEAPAPAPSSQTQEALAEASKRVASAETKLADAEKRAELAEGELAVVKPQNKDLAERCGMVRELLNAKTGEFDRMKSEHQRATEAEDRLQEEVAAAREALGAMRKRLAKALHDEFAARSRASEYEEARHAATLEEQLEARLERPPMGIMDLVRGRGTRILFGNPKALPTTLAAAEAAPTVTVVAQDGTALTHTTLIPHGQGGLKAWRVTGPVGRGADLLRWGGWDGDSELRTADVLPLSMEADPEDEAAIAVLFRSASMDGAAYRGAFIGTDADGYAFKPEGPPRFKFGGLPRGTVMCSILGGKLPAGRFRLLVSLGGDAGQTAVLSHEMELRALLAPYIFGPANRAIEDIQEYESADKLGASQEEAAEEVEGEMIESEIVPVEPGVNVVELVGEGTETEPAPARLEPDIEGEVEGSVLAFETPEASEEEEEEEEEDEGEQVVRGSLAGEEEEEEEEAAASSHSRHPSIDALLQVRTANIDIYCADSDGQISEEVLNRARSLDAPPNGYVTVGATEVGNPDSIILKRFGGQGWQLAGEASWGPVKNLVHTEDMLFWAIPRGTVDPRRKDSPLNWVGLDYATELDPEYTYPLERTYLVAVRPEDSTLILAAATTVKIGVTYRITELREIEMLKLDPVHNFTILVSFGTLTDEYTSGDNFGHNFVLLVSYGKDPVRYQVMTTKSQLVRLARNLAPP
jgi:hypothetical protein